MLEQKHKQKLLKSLVPVWEYQNTLPGSTPRVDSAMCSKLYFEIVQSNYSFQTILKEHTFSSAMSQQ